MLVGVKDTFFRPQRIDDKRCQRTKDDKTSLISEKSKEINEQNINGFFKTV